MKKSCEGNIEVMVIGDDKVAFSVAAGFALGGAALTLVTPHIAAAAQWFQSYVKEDAEPVMFVKDIPASFQCQLVIIVNEERFRLKQQLIRRVEEKVAENVIIAVNFESFLLADLQQGCRNQGRILGLNWTYPAHTTFFAEIICNDKTPADFVGFLESILCRIMNKDPYVVKAGFSVRARMLAAMAREAFYLVENGYATIESIDRSCRNDAGYYLPFAGNFRYMDLMGTHAYGVVMETLNRELSKQRQVGGAVKQLLHQNETGKGFYRCEEDEMAAREDAYVEFSKNIRQLMEKYPATFDYKEKNNP